MSRSCPICGFNQKSKLLDLCSNMKIMGAHFPETKSVYVQCTRCGTVYVDADFTQEHWDQYYASGFSNRLRWSEICGAEQADMFYQGMLDAMTSFVSKDSRILDMGANGRGEFSRFLLDKGYRNVFACDIAPHVVEDAKALGVNAFVSEFVNTDPQLKGKFDLIVLSHSFAMEHIFDLREAMFACKSMLKPEGMLFLDLPDTERYCDIENYFFFTYEHLQHFSSQSMENIEKAFGLELLLETTREGKLGEMTELYAIFKNGGTLSEEYSFETATAKGIMHYDSACRAYFTPGIARFEQSGEPLTLWGIGASTAILLNKVFTRCNVVQLIDNNPSRQGIELEVANRKLRTQGSEALATDATILILPALHGEAIAKQIRSMGIKNRVVTISDILAE